MTARQAARCCRSFASTVEVLLLYWDGLDDLAGALALKSETARTLILRIPAFLVMLTLGAGVIAMTVREPEAGLAAATLLFVLLLYMRVTAAPPAPRTA